MTRHTLLRAALGLALSAAPTLAWSQPACGVGQVVSADTAGHCCWPAQAWSSTRGACVGAPQCPAGMSAVGESCVAATAPAQAPAALAVSPAAPWGAPPVGAAPVYIPQPPQGMDGIPVRFLAYLPGDAFTVSVATPSGPQQCQVPCMMRLPLGEHAVSVQGSAAYDDTLVVEPYPMQVRVRRFRRERMIWGVAGTGAGAALAVAGLVMSNNCDSSGSFSGRCESSLAPTWLMLIGSALAVTAATTGFLTMGANRLVVTADFNVYASRQGPRVLGVGAAPSAGGGGLGVAVSF